MAGTESAKKSCLPWHVVEVAILREQKWLERALDFGLEENFNKNEEPDAPFSRDLLLRQLAIAVVSGKLKAREITTLKLNGLWTGDQTPTNRLPERHGGDWHRLMMTLVRDHFLEGGFEVISEPYLNCGRADLGIYKNGHPNMYVEIGTTSLKKTWWNLMSMPGSLFLFVPSEYHTVEVEPS